MSHFLGIDVGTSGTKALVVDDEGVVVGSGTDGMNRTAADGASRMRRTGGPAPAAIASACRDAGIGPEAIDAIGLTGQMHGLVATIETAYPSCDPLERRTMRAPVPRGGGRSESNDSWN